MFEVNTKAFEYLTEVVIFGGLGFVSPISKEPRHSDAFELIDISHPQSLVACGTLWAMLSENFAICLALSISSERKTLHSPF